MAFTMNTLFTIEVFALASLNFESVAVKSTSLEIQTTYGGYTCFININEEEPMLLNNINVDKHIVFVMRI